MAGLAAIALNVSAHPTASTTPVVTSSGTTRDGRAQARRRVVCKRRFGLRLRGDRTDLSANRRVACRVERVCYVNYNQWVRSCPGGRETARNLPLGVTGNTPDSGSGESWFDPRRGNSMYPYSRKQFSRGPRTFLFGSLEFVSITV